MIGRLQIAAEAVENIRTVVSLGREKLIFEKFKTIVTAPHQ